MQLLVFVLLLHIASRFSIADPIAQTKDSASQEWFVSTFGTGANPDIEDHQVLDLELELMRRGLRKRGVFGLAGGDATGPGHVRTPWKTIAMSRRSARLRNTATRHV